MNKTAILRTEDDDLFDEVNNLNIQGVDVTVRLTAAVSADQIIPILINFASDAAIAAFSVWLGARIEKKRTKKSTMNGQEIPSNATQITIIINQSKH